VDQKNLHEGFMYLEAADKVFKLSVTSIW
jgi:hypothetical protein